jgi:hypothetical protein
MRCQIAERAENLRRFFYFSINYEMSMSVILEETYISVVLTLDFSLLFITTSLLLNKGNNKITELRNI